MAAADLLETSFERVDADLASDQHRADQRPIEGEMHAATLYRDTLGLQPISPAELPVKFLRIGAEQSGVPRQRLAALGFEIRSGEHPFMAVDAFYLDDPDANEVEIATWRG